MKYMLLASTALTLMAGAAAAEITMSGDARMGVVYDGSDVQFSQRARVRFTGAGETDTGLSFGATIRVDYGANGSNGGWAGESTGRRGSTWISGAFGKLEMGEVLSASEYAVGDFNAIGYTSIQDFSDTPFLGWDGETVTDRQGPGAAYSYTMGDFGFFASITDGNLAGNNAENDSTDPAYSLGLSYSAAGFDLAAGYTVISLDDTAGFSSDEGTQLALKAGYTIADFSATVIYLKNEDAASTGEILSSNAGTAFSEMTGLELAYNMKPFMVNGFYKTFNSVVDAEDAKVYGLGASYALGGGATLAGGIAKSESDVGLDDTYADFGIKFRF